MESDLEAHEDSQNEATSSLKSICEEPKTKEKRAMSRTSKSKSGESAKSKKRGSKTTALQEEYDNKLKGLQESFDTKFEGLFEILHNLTKGADSVAPAGSQNRDTSGMPRSESNRSQNKDTSGMPRSDQSQRFIIPLDPNLDEDLGPPRISTNIDFDARSEISLLANEQETDELCNNIRSDIESDNESDVIVSHGGGKSDYLHIPLRTDVNVGKKKVTVLLNTYKHKLTRLLFLREIKRVNQVHVIVLIDITFLVICFVKILLLWTIKAMQAWLWIKHRSVFWRSHGALRLLINFLPIRTSINFVFLYMKVL